ncbi:hypothetical protein CBS101457_000808 [Exobasidium rhododendri]|nr:hypothetical protein CBS101457_000808 [Exobasidium rhododendri]
MKMLSLLRLQRRADHRRYYSFYPPPEPFHSQTIRPLDSSPSSSAASSSKTSSAKSSGAPSLSSLSTFGASPDLLSSYLTLPPTQLTLSSLLKLGGSPGVPPRETQVLHSARFTATELPIRLARRVDQYRSLPFIVGSNPYISKIAKFYASSFDSLASLPDIKSLEDNEKFTEKLDEMVNLHSENIPTLARGFLECKKYMSSNAISTFLDGAIHSRIGIRLIAEQHLALSHAHKINKAAHPSSVGIIDTEINVYRLLLNCAEFVGELCESTLGTKPELRIEGDREATFVGVGSHLSYIITELLKNSYRATVERHAKKQDAFSTSNRGGSSSDKAIPPIFISIAKSSTSLSIRIRDQGGGISPKNLPQIFQYTFTTAGSSGEEESKKSSGEEEAGPYSMQSMAGGGGGIGDLDGLGALQGLGGGDVGLTSGLGTLAGLGYGLPMSRIYAEHGRGERLISSVYTAMAAIRTSRSGPICWQSSEVFWEGVGASLCACIIIRC